MAVQFATDNQAALGRVKKFLTVCADPSPHIPALMVAWQQVIREDNTRGVLASQDRYGSYMIDVRYRPKPVPSTYQKILGFDPSKLSARQRNNSRRGSFSGFGPAAAGLHNNLTSSEYRYLTGPPLAPRGRNSRVITNLLTDFMRDTSQPLKWVAFGYWDEVVSITGYKFLEAHFEGKPLGKGGPVIQRDLRGVRPDGMQRAKEVLRNWWVDLVMVYGAAG